MRMMDFARLGAAASALLVLGCMALAAPASAQTTTNETKVLVDRLNRLETELNQLQQRSYRPVAGAPAQGGAPAAAGGGANAENVANLAARMDEFDSRLSEINGRIEELDHQNKALAARLDKLIADVDFRFRALEKGGGGAAPGQANADQGQAPADQGGGAGPQASQSTAEGTTLGKPPGVLGQLRSATPPDQQQAAVAPPAAAGKLPAGSVQSQYNFATDLLQQGDYPAAEKALTEFIGLHPNDPLASAAQYWLGQSFFVRQQYDRAAKAFLAGYQKYPKSPKAPEDLLKLGMSLTALNQKKEACAVYQQLAHEYPNAEARVKQSATREKQKAGCT